jgi:hypothetical protein
MLSAGSGREHIIAVKLHLREQFHLLVTSSYSCIREDKTRYYLLEVCVFCRKLNDVN